MTYHNLLIATDFSEDALQACKFVATNYSESSTKITLLSVIPDWQVPFNMYEFLPNAEQIEFLRKSLMDSANIRLNKVAKEVFSHRAVELKALFSSKTIADEICEFAKVQHCDLLVIASHGVGALGALIIGSTAQKVLKLAPCPVLVLPQAVTRAA